ncbi:DNA polymerase III subunit gamma/tau [Salicibibacter halophilus]|uniref:DNA-directed DNA polymerase n=1 Tax=Salicibibacter halophilus TaxID=2502791 RepID=A0A514LJ80_9BACI|nr:DNA polymerase III subunit gamma/tau [Salicibibacter halophilus]QDI91585.1 DNA polymerase III subunit gamma/tau [Salicibibacter halophilus]
MSYQALYRVWRPQRLEDVAGQNHITQTLQNALRQQKFAHAYLFSGPRGTGKTSAAKIVAKAINCVHAPVAEPCNECEACQGIQTGSVVDVIEIDAASNNGVDEIRYIRDNVIAAPRDVRYKVYIIDEVHMLSTGAFNALLKTLEEPPEHVVFILATTEAHKIPLTIVSRCQRFDFKRISGDTIVARMKEVVAEGEVEVEDDALHFISRAAEGGMRDALSLLDQAFSFAETKVTASDVQAITGAVSQSFLASAITSLIERDAKEAVQSADTLIREGKDPLRFMEDIIHYLRDLLLFQTAPDVEELLDRVQVDETFRSLADKIEPDWAYKTIDALHDELREMKGSSHPKIFLEMAFIHICQGDAGTEGNASADNQQVQRLVEKVQQLETKIRTLEEGQENGAARASSREGDMPRQAAPREKPKPSSSPNSSGVRQAQQLLPQASKEERVKIESRWAETLQTLKKESVPAHAWLNDAQPVAATTDAVLLVFRNEMHRGMIADKFKALTEHAIAANNDHSYHILTLLKQDWDQLKEAYRGKHQQAAAKETPNEEANEEDPLVAEAKKLVGSDLVEVMDDSNIEEEDK